MSQQWKLVPVEPTQPMLDGMTTERKKGNGVLQIWFEALAAAPLPSAGGEVEGLPKRKTGSPSLSNHRSYNEGFNTACDQWQPHVTRLQAENAALQQRLNVADQRIDDLEARAAELATAAASVKVCLELPDGRSAGWEGRCLNLLRTVLPILHAPAAKSAARIEREQFMTTIKEMWVNIGRSEKTWDAVHDWEELFRLSGRKADAAPWAFNEALRCE